jgi:hypothetical protein
LFLFHKYIPAWVVLYKNIVYTISLFVEQTQSQDNQNVEMNEGRRRMLEGPVVHVPPENLNCTSTEPPDYYTVCSGDSQYPGDDSSMYITIIKDML